jgi:hypothetical protein
MRHGIDLPVVGSSSTIGAIRSAREIYDKMLRTKHFLRFLPPSARHLNQIDAMGGYPRKLVCVNDLKISFSFHGDFCGVSADNCGPRASKITPEWTKSTVSAPKSALSLRFRLARRAAFLLTRRPSREQARSVASAVSSNTLIARVMRQVIESLRLCFGPNAHDAEFGVQAPLNPQHWQVD